MSCLPTGPVLGIETSTGMASLAVVATDSVLLAELTFRARRTMAVRLVPELDRLLRCSDLAPDDLGALAVGLGPGSFTSLRVGLATAKGIALAADLPVVGVGSLEALAIGAPLNARQPICAVIPAPRRHLYAALFARREGLDSNCLFGPELLPIDALAARLAAVGHPVALTGVLPEADRELLEAAGASYVGAVHGNPRAAMVALLGLDRLRRGERHEPGELTPIYTRPSEPEERLGRSFARSGGPRGGDPEA